MKQLNKIDMNIDTTARDLFNYVTKFPTRKLNFISDKEIYMEIVTLTQLTELHACNIVGISRFSNAYQLLQDNKVCVTITIN